MSTLPATPCERNPFQRDLDDLIHCWKTSPFPSTKLASYFPAYTELFGHLRGTSCVFIETGLLGGGSLFMWKNWLGEKARVIGIDLNPDAKKWEEYGFEIFIGDQGDPQFWKTTLNTIGQFDALLDDGGHQSFQQMVTLVEALKHLDKRAVIAIEDTHSSYMQDFNAHGDFHFLNYAKTATDVLTSRIAEFFPGRFKEVINPEIFKLFQYLYSIQFFGGIAAFKVDPNICTQANVLWNHRGQQHPDFRYQGRNAAAVVWPDPFTRKIVDVRGN